MGDRPFCTEILFSNSKSFWTYLNSDLNFVTCDMTKDWLFYRSNSIGSDPTTRMKGWRVTTSRAPTFRMSGSTSATRPSWANSHKSSTRWRGSCEVIRSTSENYFLSLARWKNCLTRIWQVQSLKRCHGFSECATEWKMISRQMKSTRLYIKSKVAFQTKWPYSWGSISTVYVQGTLVVQSEWWFTTGKRTWVIVKCVCGGRGAMQEMQWQV